MKEGKRSVLSWIVLILLVVGGLNWGLVGLFDWNLVEAILGLGLLTKIVYVLVAVAAIVKVYKVATR